MMQLVCGHFAADERVQCEFKIFRLFQFVGKRLKRFRRDGVEHGVRVGDAAGRRHHAELEFIARKREGRGPIAVGRIAADKRKGRNAHAHDGRGRHALVAPRMI